MREEALPVILKSGFTVQTLSIEVVERRRSLCPQCMRRSTSVPSSVSGLDINTSGGGKKKQRIIGWQHSKYVCEWGRCTEENMEARHGRVRMCVSHNVRGDAGQIETSDISYLYL